MTTRERLLTIEGGDPFAPVDLAHEAGDTSFPAAIAPEIVSEYPGRWVLMRPSEAGRVIADAADLDELLARDERQPGDVGHLSETRAVNTHRPSATTLHSLRQEHRSLRYTRAAREGTRWSMGPAS